MLRFLFAQPRKGSFTILRPEPLMAVPGCRTDFGDFFKAHERLFGPAIRHTVSRNVSFAVRPFLNDEPPRLHRGSRGGIRKTHV